MIMSSVEDIFFGQSALAVRLGKEAGGKCAGGRGLKGISMKGRGDSE